MQILINNGNEEILVQVKDLKFLYEYNLIPVNIKKKITTELSLKEDDRYLKFDDAEFIEYMKKQYYILDSNKFNSLSDEEIKKEYYNNQLEIRQMLKAKKTLNKKGKNDEKIDDILDCLKYYQNSIKLYMKRKKQNKRLAYKK